MKTPTGCLGKVGLLLIGTLIAIAVGEGVVRSFGLVPVTDQNNAETVVDRTGDYRKFKPNLKAIPYSGIHLTTNERGYRSTGPDASNPEALRIAVLGDSWAFGWGVEDGHTILDQLAGLLREASAPVDIEILSFASPGYAMRDHLLVLKHEVLPLDPDYCLVLVHLNDANYLGPGRTAREPESVRRERSPSIAQLAASSKLGKFLYAYLLLPIAIQLELPNDGYPNTVAGWYAEDSASRRLYDDSVANLTSLLQNHNLPASFYLLPIPMSRRNPYPLGPMNDVVKSIFTGNGVEIHELLQSYSQHSKDKLVLHAFDMHPNPFASRLLAEEISIETNTNPDFLEVVQRYSAPH